MSAMSFIVIQKLLRKLWSIDVKLFVYGTLKQSYGNHSYFLSRAKLLGEDLTKDPEYFMNASGIPFVRKVEEGGNHIKGELYEVPEEDVPPIDRLEGHPNWYRRVEVPLISGETAWIYLNDEYADRKNCGDYTQQDLRDSVVPIVKDEEGRYVQEWNR